MGILNTGGWVDECGSFVLVVDAAFEDGARLLTLGIVNECGQEACVCVRMRVCSVFV